MTFQSATNATNSQLSNTLVDIVDEIDPLHDLQHLRQLTASTLTQAIPKKILYYNYQVGECMDMLFGVSLVDYASSRGLKDGELPKIVSLCIADVETRGLRNEGIYRVSLLLSQKHRLIDLHRCPVNIRPLWRCVELVFHASKCSPGLKLSLQAERDEANFRFDHTKVDVSSVAALLKVCHIYSWILVNS